MMLFRAGCSQLAPGKCGQISVLPIMFVYYSSDVTLVHHMDPLSQSFLFSLIMNQLQIGQVRYGVQNGCWV